MKSKYEELINKYLDKEANSSELEFINNNLQSNSEFKFQFSTQKFVHDSLADLPAYSAPENITENIMNKILATISVKYKKSYFFRIVISIFLFLIVGVLFTFFSLLTDLPFIQESQTYVQNFMSFSKPLMSIFSKVLSSEILKTFSVLTGLLVLLFFYFSFNSFKGFKNRLKEF